MLILCSLTALNNLIKDFGAPCKMCNKCDYEIIATKKIGIRQLLKIECKCGHECQAYSMPKNSN